MKKLLLLWPLLIFIGCTQQSAPLIPPETTNLNGSTYELEWKDDFEQNRIASVKADYRNHSTGWWIYQEDWGESKNYNGYHTWASKYEDNISYEDGSLKCTVKVDHNEKVCSGGTVFSYEQFLLKDSMWEIRFKVPNTKAGDWLCFMAFPKKKDGTFWYKVSDRYEVKEITAIETDFRNNRFRCSETVHDEDMKDYIESHGGYYDGLNYAENWVYINFDDSFYNEWHTLQYIWNENEIIEYLDGKEVVRKQKDAKLKAIDSNDLYAMIELDCSAIGESFGPIDVNMPTHSYYIDYVKVWRKK